MKIWLANKHIEKLNKFANDSFPLETGGVLMGYRSETGDYVVTHIVGPGLNAKHFPYKFLPDHEYQIKAIQDIFNETNHKSDYLGDWHTHPTGSCKMSWRDNKTLKNIACETLQYPPIMMIGSQSNNSWKYSANKYDSNYLFKFCRTTALENNIY